MPPIAGRTAEIARLFLRVLGLTRGHRPALAFAIICGLLYTLLTLVPPLVVREIVRTLIGGEGGAEMLLWLAAVLFVAPVLRSVSRYGEAVVSHIVAYRILHELTGRVFAHV